jgi:hypothetical protein
MVSMVGSKQVEGTTISYTCEWESELGLAAMGTRNAFPDGDGEGVVSWVREKLGFDPDPAQERVLSSGRSHGILNCTRQWGKSTVAAAKAVHQVATVNGSLTLVVSPCARQSGELVRKAEGFAHWWV